MLYVADLDGIASGSVQIELLESLAKRDVPLAVDAGADSPEKVRTLLNCGVEKVILGLETLSDLAVTKELVAEFGEERILFSLDLKEGIPLGDGVTSRHPIEIVSRVISYGVRHLIVLDLASIGINSGIQTGSLCHAIKRRWPEMVLWTGGGVRSIVDLHRISLCRVDGVMVASALHDGQITPADWQSFLQLLSDGDTMQMMDA